MYIRERKQKGAHTYTYIIHSKKERKRGRERERKRQGGGIVESKRKRSNTAIDDRSSNRASRNAFIVYTGCKKMRGVRVTICCEMKHIFQTKRCLLRLQNRRDSERMEGKVGEREYQRSRERERELRENETADIQ